MIWGFLASVNACDIISIPPTTTAHFTPIPDPEKCVTITYKYVLPNVIYK
jgi:hypothetical protein